ncbi:hypothetical protein ACFQHV_12785 [Promicromonospora thailandica]|uniref:Protein kinase domain n=1 Tax=Promicromonospora thailandica TaxID=765201 RepID=A0A9X2G2Z8_9MICO|nr:hypothetical protein [Promicromonospora thailandica]MCP2265949.1 Protein kinase domain [Promicromonospora thailandica]BFF21478.1 hypothetical protein GCM10025730_49990 [Promicromonospora thailandica]
MHYIESAELVRVAVPTDAAARAHLVRRLDTLATLDHPHLVPLIAISPNGPDNLDVRLSRTGAVDLPTAVGSRGPLTPAEGAGVTVAIAQALAALHGVGLVHGGVRPTDVLLRSDGTAMLRPRVTLPEHSDDPVDVTSLATLIESVLGFPGPSLHSKADEALRAVLARARAEDPRDRPEPGTLATLAHDAVTPEPVRLPDGSALVSAAISGPVPLAGHVPLGAHTPSAWRSAARTLTGSFAAVDGRAWAAKARRRATMPLTGPAGAQAVGNRAQARTTPVTLVATGMIAAGVVAGITAGVMALPHMFGADEPAVAAASPEAVASPRWGSGISPVANAKDPAGAAVALTERRLALLAGAVSDIRTVNLEGSPAYAADQKIIDELKHSGAQVVGASAEVVSTEVVTVGPGAASALQDVEPASLTRTSEDSATPEASDGKKQPVQAVVRIEYTITSHLQISSDGETTVPASDEVADLVLVWTTGGWRVSEVR